MAKEEMFLLWLWEPMYNQRQFVFCSAYIQGEISLVPSNPIEQTLELFVPSFEDICFIYF